MKTCKTCKWWNSGEEYSYVTDPEDFDTGLKMKMPFEVKICHSPHILFHERPVAENQAAVYDGSGYMGKLITASDFGCVLHETREEVTEDAV